jgi:hypothetical protein
LKIEGYDASWGTTSTSAQLTGNFSALDDISIGDCRLVNLLAENRSQRVRGLLQYSVIIDEKVIDEAKIQAIRDKTSVSRVTEELLKGWLSGLYGLKNPVSRRNTSCMRLRSIRQLFAACAVAVLQVPLRSPGQLR